MVSFLRPLTFGLPLLGNITIDLSNLVQSSVIWHSCSAGGRSFYCGFLTVPLNWDKPHEGGIKIWVERQHCTDPESRIGSLLYNPGGPGVTPSHIDPFSSELHKHFDIVTMHTRGVGWSTPVTCSASLETPKLNYWPRDAAEVNALVRYNQEFAQDCAQLNGNLIKHMDTVSVAKDIEALRRALGDEKLNFVGFSYGTRIASTYARLFPRNVRTLIMDAVASDSSFAPSEMLQMAADAAEVAFLRFAAWCESVSEHECPLNDVWGASIPDRLRRVVDMGNWGSNTYGSDTLDVMATNILASEHRWPELAGKLAAIINGTGGILWMDTAAVRKNAAHTIIECNDMTDVFPDPMVFISESMSARSSTKNMLGASLSHWTQAGCLGWPFASPSLPDFTASDEALLAPTLIVSALFDMLTPHAFAEYMQTQIPGSVLLTRNSSEHCAYKGDGRQHTTSRIMEAYLINKTLPEPGTIVQD